LSVLCSLEDGMMVAAVTESQLCNDATAERTLTLANRRSLVEDFR
jgi:hypothetical protein